MKSPDSRSARLALMVGHAAGMIDMVSLPLWVGGLVESYKYSPAQAGGLVTSFLIGVVAASCLLAPLFHRYSMRWVPAVGFAMASLCFMLVWFASGFLTFLVLHILAGLSVGCALSAIHGTIGRTANPHRTFALATTGFGVFSVIFMGASIQIIAATEPRSLFPIFSGVMAVAALVNLVLFPQSKSAVSPSERAPAEVPSTAGFTAVVWFLILGLLGMNFNQAMNFSFIERIASDRGWAGSAINTILLCVAFFSLLPAPIAVLMEKKLNPVHVGMAGVMMQAILSAILAFSLSLMGFGAAALFVPFVMIFSHTFLFGLISRVDPSGRAVAANPAITMGGGALGPLAGGLMVQNMGYPGLSITTVIIAIAVVCCLVLAATRLVPARLPRLSSEGFGP